jgi:branched-chain amino acid transport system permease protein
MVWLLAVFCIAVCRNLVKTAHGLPFLAVREDEVASAAMGVNVTRVKVTAFVLGSMFAGAAGALLTHYEGFITGAYFSMDISFIILTMVVLGGTGSITGSAVAAAFLSYLPEQLRSLKNPDGTSLTVTAASIAASLIAVVVAVALIKRVMTDGRQTKAVKAAIYVGLIVGAVAVKLLLQLLFSHVHALADIQVEAGQLRMVIFAVTLIVLMLLRPQGIFGHHEFSWAWLRSLIKRQPPQDPPAPAVAA